MLYYDRSAASLLWCEPAYTGNYGFTASAAADTTLWLFLNDSQVSWAFFLKGNFNAKASVKAEGAFFC
jgi:hypothetical protein